MSKSPDAFRTISEVAEVLSTPAHVLRFWESRFTQIKPVKRAGGRRYYRPADVALLGGIRKLLHDDGLTIRGVQKILKEQGVRHVAGLAGDMAEDVPEASLAGGRLDAAETAAPEAPAAQTSAAGTGAARDLPHHDDLRRAREPQDASGAEAPPRDSPLPAADISVAAGPGPAATPEFLLRPIHLHPAGPTTPLAAKPDKEAAASGQPGTDPARGADALPDAPPRAARPPSFLRPSVPSAAGPAPAADTRPEPRTPESRTPESRADDSPPADPAGDAVLAAITAAGRGTDPADDDDRLPAVPPFLRSVRGSGKILENLNGDRKLRVTGLYHRLRALRDRMSEEMSQE